MSSATHCTKCGRAPAFGSIGWHHTHALGARIEERRIPICEYCLDDIKRLWGTVFDWLEARARRETVQVFNARKDAERAQVLARSRR